jgi:UDP-glucose 4-epimerase
MSKKLLITGATGFIGTVLANQIGDNYKIFRARRNSLEIDYSGDSMIEVDLSHADFVDRLPKGIDIIVHLAQSSRYRDFPEGVSDMQLVNIDATVRLLEWARVNGVKHFVFTSTANVYASSDSPFTEASPTLPSSFYGASKLAAEHLALQYQKHFQVDILRLFTVYGPGQRNMLIHNIIERIKSRNEITLADGVGVYLSPVYVDDVVNVIKKLFEVPPKNTSRLLNVCGDCIVSLHEIVRILETLLRQSAVIRVTGNEVSYFTGSNGLLKNVVGEFRFLDIEAGLQRTVFADKYLN